MVPTMAQKLIIRVDGRDVMLEIVDGPAWFNQNEWTFVWSQYGLQPGDEIFKLDISHGPFVTGIAAPPSWLVHAPGEVEQKNRTAWVEKKKKEPA